MASVSSIAWRHTNISGVTHPDFSLNFNTPVPLTANLFTVTGDKTSVTIGQAIANNDYRLYTSNITPGHNGGSYRVQLSRTAVTPNLTEDIDYTFGWDPDGNTWAMPTADIPAVPVLSVSVADTIVAAGGQTVATFDLTADGSHFTADDVTVSAGAIKGALTSVSARQWTMPITAPTGEGVVTVSVAENRIYPGNTAASASFDYYGDIVVAIALVDEVGHAKTYLTTGETFYARVTYNRDGVSIPLSGFSLTEGMTIRGQASPNDRTWIYELTAPSTGAGEGVVSILEDVIVPGNNAVTATFTYIDRIEGELELSGRGVEQGGLIIAEFNFDHPVPNFRADFLEFSVPGDVLGIGGAVLGIAGAVLGLDSQTGAPVLGNATALDDASRKWVVDVQAPQQGEGTFDIILPEDAIV